MLAITDINLNKYAQLRDINQFYKCHGTAKVCSNTYYEIAIQLNQRNFSI